MAVERRDPLPAGRYSIFVTTDEMPRWHAWTTAHAATVRIVSSITKKALVDENDPIWSITPTGELVEKIVGAEFLFDVTAPTLWVGLGFPDIETRPPEAWVEEHTEDPGKHLPSSTPMDELKNLVLLAGGLYLGGVLLTHVLRSSSQGSRKTA